MNSPNTRIFLTNNNKQQSLQTCERERSLLASLHAWSLGVWHSVAATKTTLTTIWKSSGFESWRRNRVSLGLTQLFARVGRELAARIRVYVDTRKVNNRMIAGIACVGFATFSDIFYTVFDKNAKLSWMPYYENWFFLFLCIGPYFQSIFNALAAYLVFVNTRTKRVYFLSLLWLGSVAKIIWLLIADSHESFLSVPQILVYFYVLCFLLFAVFIADYLAWRKYHRADALEARLDSLSNAHKLKLLPAEKIADDFVTTLTERKLKAY